MKSLFHTLLAAASIAAAAGAQKPNIRLSSVEANSLTFRIGQKLNVACVTRNAAFGVIAPASRGAYFISRNSTISTADQLIHSFNVPSLKGTQSYRDSYQWTVPNNIPDGTLWLGAIADYQNLIDEGNENDNTASFKATGYGRMDLVVTHIGSPSSAATGVDYNIPMLQIQNQGGMATDKIVKLYLFLSKDRKWDVTDKLVGQNVIPKLSYGQKRTIPTKFTVPTGTELGRYYLIVYADPTRMLTNEYSSNNQLSVTLDVYAQGAVQPFGTGCVGSNGRVTHDVVPVTDGPMIGRGVTFRMTNGPSTSIALVNVGASNTRMGALTLPLELSGIGAPGCRLYASMDLLVPASTTANGLATRTIQIPSLEDLIGARIYSQFLAFDSHANALGWTFSNGNTVTLGGRVAN